MRRIQAWAATACLLLIVACAATSIAEDAGLAVVTPNAELKWKDAGIPGVSAAVVEGDMEKGASRFYLKYATGLKAPLHHHSPDHFVTVVSGTLVLTIDGKEHTLPAGSYFSLTGGKPHAARVDGKEDCVMFIQAMGPWDVVLEKAP